MKKMIILIPSLLLAAMVFAQTGNKKDMGEYKPKFGIKAGYNWYETAANKPPYPLPFDPNKTNLKNGLLQLFIGYRF
jgi:hypothetical protein